MELTETIIRLSMATLLGGAIGAFREREGKAAGLRTHILVSVGSALFMLISIGAASQQPGADITRIAAQVVTGIGFLGAGMIIRAGRSVLGLTTAASVWVVSAIGLAAGAGLMKEAVVATVLAVIVLQFLLPFEKKYLRRPEE